MTAEADRARERRRRLAEARVYLVLTLREAGDGWRAALGRALASGAVDLLQLRDRRGDDEATRAVARELRALCDAQGVLLLLNDRPDLAAAWDLDGAHVGQADLPPRRARDVLGPHRLLGLSTHDAGELAVAREEPVDYAGLGPCFATSSKRLERTPGGGALVAACLPAAGTLPVFPIGGIAPGNAAELAAAGARRAAVGAGILEAPDPAAAARALRDLLSGE